MGRNRLVQTSIFLCDDHNEKQGNLAWNGGNMRSIVGLFKQKDGQYGLKGFSQKVYVIVSLFLRHLTVTFFENNRLNFFQKLVPLKFRGV